MEIKNEQLAKDTLDTLDPEKAEPSRLVSNGDMQMLPESHPLSSSSVHAEVAQTEVGCVGVVEGADVGVRVGVEGASVGILDGAAEGARVGILDGARVGMLD